MNVYRYCTDEDIAVQASADFPLLVPRDQCVAQGVDGSIRTVVSPWTLLSASGVLDDNPAVAAGQVVHLTRPTTVYRPPGELFAVGGSDVANGGIRIRRKGLAAETGYHPAGSLSALGSIEFGIFTLGPQIEAESFQLEQRFGISDIIAGRRPADLFDPRELVRVTVFSVLASVYSDRSRGNEGAAGQGRGTPDVWAAKARLYAAQLAELLARVSLHWSASAGGAAGLVQAPARLVARLSR